jgi:hypothetical protein
MGIANFGPGVQEKMPLLRSSYLFNVLVLNNIHSNAQKDRKVNSYYKHDEFALFFLGCYKSLDVGLYRSWSYSS